MYYYVLINTNLQILVISYLQIFSKILSYPFHQVTFIYIALLTIKIVSKHLTVSNCRIVSVMYNNMIKHSILS